MSIESTPTACACGDPSATSLDPAEVVVHRTDGPCYIEPVVEVGGGQ